MDPLISLVKGLNKEETRNFTLLSLRTNEHKERKDLDLFDRFRKLKSENEEAKISGLLYGTDKNAYYRLKNRLMEDVQAHLLHFHYNFDEHAKIFNQILLSRVMINKKLFDLSLWYLQKAEKKAKQIASAELLELIYNEMVRLSQDLMQLNPEEYIEKRKQNRVQLRKIQAIDDLLSVLSYRLKTSQTFGKKDHRVNEMLQKTIAEFSNPKDLKQNPELRFKIYHAVSRILLQEQNYSALEKYLIKTYSEFSKEKLFDKNNHDTKLQMLTYLANALFKNSKSQLSLQYLHELKNEMENFHRLHYEKYLFYYYNISVNNYAQNETEKALEILLDAKANPIIQKQAVYSGYINLNLAVTYFGLKQYRQALKNLVGLYLHEWYKSLDNGFRFRIAITELLMRYENKDEEFIEVRIQQILKEFPEIIKDTDYKKDIRFIHLIESLNKERLDRKVQKNLIHDYLKNTYSGAGRHEDEIINYKDWLENLN